MSMLAHGNKTRLLKNHILALAPLLAVAALTPQIVLAAGDMDLDGSTPHGSFIENQMDPALEGTWSILQVQIEQGGQTIVFPNSGATLSILDSGSFREDYSTESNGPRATDIVVGDLVSPTRLSPVSTCKMVTTGEAIGVLSAYWEEATGTMDAPEIRVSISPAASTRPTVRCAGSSEILGNMVTPALGMGRPSGNGDAGPYVAYSYMLDRDNFTDSPNAFTDLEIWSVSDNPVRTRYYLRKVE